MFNYIYQWFDPQAATEFDQAALADRFASIYLRGVMRSCAMLQESQVDDRTDT